MPIKFCTSVGNPDLEKAMIAYWQDCGLNASLDYQLPVAVYRRYKSKKNTVKLRFWMYLGYPLSVFLRSFFWPKSVIIATSNPFFLPFILRFSSWIRGHKLINLVYDLYPEALIHGAGLSEHNLISKICAGITRFGIRFSDYCIYLSPQWGQYIEQKYGPARKFAILPPGATCFSKDVLAKKRNRSPIRVLYAGHMGHLHDYSTLRDFLEQGERVLDSKLLEKPEIEILIYANGPGCEALKEALDKKANGIFLYTDFALKLSILPSGNDETWQKNMERAEVGLITLSPGAENTVMPSKVYSALLAGQAILALCPQQCDLSNLVQSNRVGWVIENGAVCSLETAFAEIASDTKMLKMRQEESLKLGTKNYSYRKIAEQYRKVFADLK